jgi:G3E family GTPase
VHELFEGSPDRDWREGEPRVSKMVFIGRDLDREAFQEAFRRCLADGGADWPPGKKQEAVAAA